MNADQPTVEGCIYHVLELNSNHVTDEDMKLLEASSLSFGHDENGYFLVVCYDPQDAAIPAGCSQAIRDLFALAAKHSCAYLHLEDNGCILPGLPLFDW